MSLFHVIDQKEHQQAGQDRGGQNGGHHHGLDLHGVGGDADRRCLRLVIRPVSPDQKAVGIDAVGGAGDQDAVVLSWLDGQRAQLVGLDDQDLVHFVGQHLVQHPEQKDIPLLQLVQIGKQLGAGQAPVAGDDAVGALPAHGQAGPL